MKKFFLFFCTLLCIAMLAFGQQISNSEVAEIISQSQEYNNQVINPDLIYPGQVLTYVFEDGSIHSIEVIKDDSQWTIVRDKIGQLVKEHGQIVEPSSNMPDSQTLNQTQDTDRMAIKIAIWIMLMFVLILLVALFFSEVRKWRKSDPVTSGPAQIHGGVTDNTITSLIRARYPNVQILSIKKGKLYGHGTPYYNFRPLSFKSLLNKLLGKEFNGEVGYQAEVVFPDTRRHLVQTLAGCGNEIKREGKFMTGLTFIPDDEQSDDLLMKVEKEQKVQPTYVEQESRPVATSKLVENEIETIIMESVGMVESLSSSQTLHKATITYDYRIDGSRNIVAFIETKNTPARRKKAEEAKK